MSDALKITSLSELDQDLVDQTFAELNELMQEAHPEIELTRGVFADLVQFFSAVLGTKNQTEIDRLIRSGSLLEIQKDPALADDTIVDRVFSNYRVERKTGENAVGSIQVIVSKDVSVTIEKGLIFTANGVQFAADEAFVGRSTGSIIQASTDRPMAQLADGNFAFTITATAVEAGSQGNIQRGTLMIPTSLPANFVTAFASTDFINGFPTETNAEVLTRLQEGIAAKAWSNRVNISALVKENFDRVLHVSTIGFGDPEMSRDQHSIFPVSFGGRQDSYTQTRELFQETTLEKTATLVDTAAEGGIWQFSIGRDDAPGFYEVSSIKLPSASADDNGFVPTSDSRTVDLSTAGEFVPDIETAKEGIYSRYQTAVIQFLDPQTSVTDKVVGESAQDYTIGVLAMPEIKAIQDFANQRDQRPPAADNLVKAPVPCFLSVNFTVRVAAGSEGDVDTAQIRNDVAATVNNLGFCGQLHASTVADVVHNTISGKTAIGAVDMFGRIRRPDGQQVFIRDDAVLEIPEQPGEFVTGRTTIFYLPVDNIGVTVTAAGFPNV